MNQQQQNRKSSSGISALILAAGSSQRMGRPKQLMALGDKTLLEHTLANACRAKVDELVLVLGYAAEEIQQKIPTPGIRVVINENYRDGMATSLRLGLSAMAPQAAGALVILADQPFVQPSTLDRMIEFHSQSGAQIVIPVYKGFRGNPVLLDRYVFPELKSLTGDIGCRAIFGSHSEGIRKLSVDDPAILVDVDNVEDFQKLAGSSQTGTISDLLPERDLEIAGDRPGETSLPELIVVGRDAVARALLSLARLLHFNTVLVDPFLKPDEMPEAQRVLHRLDFSLLPRNPEQYIVIASRGQFDEEALEQAFATDALYIALMANHARSKELLGILSKRGVSPGNPGRLHAPAGLEIGAATPEEIALSIMAQIVTERRAR